MRKHLRSLVLYILKRLAKFRLRKFNGKVIVVTGSIGKTSTKDAIFSVLNSKFKVKRNAKSMNSDFGILLTILDIESGFSSVRKWSWFLMKGFFHSLFADHSDVLLLELGVDKPGDMDFLLSVVKPNIAIMTNIAEVHMEEGQFKTLKDIFEEKQKAVTALGEEGIAILNLDDKFLNYLAKSRKRNKTITFGSSEDADYRFTTVKTSTEGTSFYLHSSDYKFQVKSSVLGTYQSYVLTPAVICGHLMDMSDEEILIALERYKLPPGRMSLIPAIEGATILDSTYNSSPEALKAALKLLDEIEAKRKVAVLGNMNELGEISEAKHRELGSFAAQSADLIITVGSEAKALAEDARERGHKAVFDFVNTAEAVDFYKDRIKNGDLILVKGSQNKVRLERFVKEFMLTPEDAKTLLVRQEKVWDLKI
ncbi:hypothetical protein COU74_02705 [Candidatus Peregrinibacteria bacterium CG10_big_fil_rev_8_21_14_0_10_36_19]|nr:MAG: hypothetical protein COU74_02705 [Candidatus Peregrinibacteria bacterium CG10_big_fil_rev_8_21_14_0_10_36_19]